MTHTLISGQIFSSFLAKCLAFLTSHPSISHNRSIKKTCEYILGLILIFFCQIVQKYLRGILIKCAIYFSLFWIFTTLVTGNNFTFVKYVCSMLLQFITLNNWLWFSKPDFIHNWRYLLMPNAIKEWVGVGNTRDEC